MKNTFNLDQMNQSLMVANVDNRPILGDEQCSQEIVDDAFKIIAKTTTRHLRLCTNDFGSISKGDLLGMIIDDMSNKVLKQ